MKIRPRHLSFAVLGAVFALAGSLQTSAQAQTLDWSAVNYTAGSLNQNVAVGGNNALFAFSGTTSFATVTGAGGSATPAIGDYNTNNAFANGGTGGGGGKALQLYVDFANNTANLTLIVTFATAVPIVQFTLFDVDAGTATNTPIGLLGAGGSYNTYTFQDQVSNIVASADGTAYNLNPTITRSANNTGTGNAAYGNATSNNNVNTANVSVAFSNPAGIKSFQFTYGNHVDASNANGTTTTQADPSAQIIALGNIVVPEPGPVVGVVGGLLFLAAWTVRRRLA